MLRLLFLLALALAPASPAAGQPDVSTAGQPNVSTAGQPADAEWNFTVRLDSKPIGSHSFKLRKSEAGIEIESRAFMEVTLLGFSIYSYKHEARELWKNGCLSSIESRTDDNGSKTTLSGSLGAEGFVVVQGTKRQSLPTCAMSFAYWNPAFRQQPRLLNPQTGDYLEVTFEKQGAETILVNGFLEEAVRYLLRGKELEITLWYSADGERWLALDSRAKGNSLISYRLESSPDAAKDAARSGASSGR